MYEDMDKYERGGMNVQREPGLSEIGRAGMPSPLSLPLYPY